MPNFRLIRAAVKPAKRHEHTNRFYLYIYRYTQRTTYAGFAASFWSLRKTSIPGTQSNSIRPALTIVTTHFGNQFKYLHNQFLTHSTLTYNYLYKIDDINIQISSNLWLQYLSQNPTNISLTITYIYKIYLPWHKVVLRNLTIHILCLYNQLM